MYPPDTLGAVWFKESEDSCNIIIIIYYIYFVLILYYKTKQYYLVCFYSEVTSVRVVN